jgi:hypothetical protein
MNAELDRIGFYTLSDERARTASHSSPLQRCELLLGSRCNFNCPYCRNVGGKDISFDDACAVVRYWASNRLEAVRFSGGEPTLWPSLANLVLYASTCGADIDLYERLVIAGVNDFSISLDACCAAGNAAMTGQGSYWERVTQNIRRLAKLTYVTVGIVLTEQNWHDADKIIEFAVELGVSDIRVIPAAQISCDLPRLKPVSPIGLFPILDYRSRNLASGRAVRGISDGDTNRCPLVLDDMAVCEGNHYPCIIYLREGGDAIGRMSSRSRDERHQWFQDHDTHRDRICRNNCLDVCVDYNNRWILMNSGYTSARRVEYHRR